MIIAAEGQYGEKTHVKNGSICNYRRKFVASVSQIVKIFSQF